MLTKLRQSPTIDWASLFSENEETRLQEYLAKLFQPKFKQRMHVSNRLQHSRVARRCNCYIVAIRIASWHRGTRSKWSPIGEPNCKNHGVLSVAYIMKSASPLHPDLVRRRTDVNHPLTRDQSVLHALPNETSIPSRIYRKFLTFGICTAKRFFRSRRSNLI